MSSLGIGTYLGEMSDVADQSYAASVQRALDSGINFIDTSLNYRNQRSERAIARAITRWIHEGAGARDEIVVCTKAGYLVPDAIPFNVLRAEDVAGGMHSMAPAFLSDQIERSRRNLGLETLDVFYLHNPETQLAHVPAETFYARIHSAFELLEHLVDTGEIRYYGAATWNGFRQAGALSLTRMHNIATQIAGTDHHFRFIQLPLNLAMPEAARHPLEEGRTVFELGMRFGITVVCSATLLQARLAGDVPAAIRFTRTTPGVTVALVGMSQPEHVDDNLTAVRALA